MAAPSEALTDSELIARARAGDHVAFHALVDRHAGGLYRLAAALIGDPMAAQDVVQETLLGAFTGLSKFRGEASVKTWLTRILVRQVARHHRREVPRRTAPLTGSELAPGRPDAGAVADTRLDFQQALARLGPEHREVILLREVQGLSYHEVAAVLNLPQGTVESRLARARALLRQSLREYLS